MTSFLSFFLLSIRCSSQSNPFRYVRVRVCVPQQAIQNACWFCVFNYHFLGCVCVCVIFITQFFSSFSLFTSKRWLFNHSSLLDSYSRPPAPPSLFLFLNPLDDVRRFSTTCNHTRFQGLRLHIRFADASLSCRRWYLFHRRYGSGVFAFGNSACLALSLVNVGRR